MTLSARADNALRKALELPGHRREQAAMRFSPLIIVLTLGVCCPSSGSGQTLRLTPEAVVSIAWGHLFRFDDRTFGDRPNIGGGIGVVHRSGLGVEFQLNRTLRLSPQPAPCGVGTVDREGQLVPVPCVGGGREGVRSATIASLNVLYHLSDARIRPYLTGGAGGLWSTGVTTVTIHGGGPEAAIQTESEWRDTGLALNWGGGIRVVLTPSIFLRSEFRLYDSSILSRQNLSLIRASMGLGLNW